MTSPARGSAGGRPTNEEDNASIASSAERPVLDRILGFARLGYGVPSRKIDPRELVDVVQEGRSR